MEKKNEPGDIAFTLHGCNGGELICTKEAEVFSIMGCFGGAEIFFDFKRETALNLAYGILLSYGINCGDAYLDGAEQFIETHKPVTTN